jgi:hypothetical protein
MWRSIVRTYLPYIERNSVENVQQVVHCRYEDVVSDPVSEGKRIFSELGMGKAVNGRVLRRLKAAHVRSMGIRRGRTGSEVERATELMKHELIALNYDL